MIDLRGFFRSSTMNADTAAKAIVKAKAAGLHGLADLLRRQINAPELHDVRVQQLHTAFEERAAAIRQQQQQTEREIAQLRAMPLGAMG